MAEIGSAFVSIIPSARGFGTSLTKQIDPQVKDAGKSTGLSFGKVFAAAAGLGLGVKAFGFLKDSVGEAREAAVIGKRTDNVIKKMGASAWTSSKQVGELASALSLKVGVDDEAIQAGQNLLLTFENLRNEAGAGNDIFDRTTTLMVDMSAAMGTDAKSSAIQLGKALNNPVKGVSALTRVGVSFTEQQQKQIEKLTESGEILEAQKIILGEVEKQFGGAAEAMATPADKARVAWGNLQEKIGTALLPVLDDLAEKGTEAIGWIEDQLPAIRDFAGELFDELAPAVEEIQEAFGNFAGEGDGLVDFLNDDLLPAVGAVADVVGFLVDLVDDLPGPVKDFGVKAGAAAVLLWKLNGALLVAKARASGILGPLATGETRLNALKTAAKGAAGVGGLLLLTDALSDAKDEGADFGDIIKGAAGGAGIGAMFGPIGALVGAVAGGGLTALMGAFAETEEEARKARLELLRTEGFKNAEEDAGALRDALAGVVKQYGKVTRASVEASFMGEDGKLDADIQKLRDLGVSMDTIVSATLGQADAQAIVQNALGGGLADLQEHADAAKKVWDDAKDGILEFTINGQKVSQSIDSDAMQVYKDAWLEASAAVEEMTTSQDVFNERIGQNTDAIADHREQMHKLADDLNIPIKLYKDWPKEVRTRFEANGLVETTDDALSLIKQYKGLQNFDRITALVSVKGIRLTAQDVIGLQRRYDLTPKQITTLFEQEGIDPSLRGIARLTEKMNLTPKEIKTVIEATGVDATVADVKKVQDELVELDEMKAKPTVDVNIDPARAALLGIRDEILNLSGNYPPPGNGRTTPRTVPRQQAPLDRSVDPRQTVGRTAPLINIERVEAHDYQDFMVQAQRRHRQAMLGGVPL